jgi:hypothetical protein
LVKKIHCLVKKEVWDVALSWCNSQFFRSQQNRKNLGAFGCMRDQLYGVGSLAIQVLQMFGLYTTLIPCEHSLIQNILAPQREAWRLRCEERYPGYLNAYYGSRNVACMKCERTQVWSRLSSCTIC